MVMQSGSNQLWTNDLTYGESKWCEKQTSVETHEIRANKGRLLALFRPPNGWRQFSLNCRNPTQSL